MARFRLRGGTIGRARDNDWVLPDAERIVSGHHARIVYEQGIYYLEDTSSNGTYLNGQDSPLPPGQPNALQHGDLLAIGDYEIRVEIEEDSSAMPPAWAESPLPPAQPPEFVAKPYAPPTDSPHSATASGSPPPADDLAHDPWADRRYPESTQPPPPSSQWAGVQRDHLAPDAINFQPPSASPELIPSEGESDAPDDILPDDWWKLDDEPSETPAASASAALPAEPTELDPLAADPFELAPAPNTTGPVQGAGEQQPPALPPRPEHSQTPPHTAGAEPSLTQPPQAEPPQAPLQQAHPAPAAPPPAQPPQAVPPQAPPLQAAPAQALSTQAAPAPAQPRQPAQPRRAEPPPPSTQPEVSQAPLQPEQQRPAPAPESAVAPGASAPSASSLLAAFYDGLGLQPPRLTSEEAERELRQTGRLLRALTDGLMEVLKTRSTLKGEFRLSQTIVQSAENNPLKFCINAQQALTQLFVDKRPGFMAPEASFGEALTDIKQHQIAVVAGMRAAFDCLIDKFEPETIEAARKAAGKRRAGLLADKQWAFYRDYHSDFRANAGDDFQGIFGEDFVRAYEAQIRRLMSGGGEDA